MSSLKQFNKDSCFEDAHIVPQDSVYSCHVLPVLPKHNGS